jgi:hypothetical protein
VKVTDKQFHENLVERRLSAVPHLIGRQVVVRRAACLLQRAHGQYAFCCLLTLQLLVVVVAGKRAAGIPGCQVTIAAVTTLSTIFLQCVIITRFNPLEPSGKYTYHLLQQSVTLHFVFTCFVCFSLQTAIISLNSR